ncbi:uncharacterized protein LOC142986366 [Anticarsia gemmatalis]|uniref:uncharacterized protein LOC142986366 n=1 Tax=Anticarsia gemmatalis TaxID=129554 RepID=UPI003F757239
MSGQLASSTGAKTPGRSSVAAGYQPATRNVLFNSCIVRPATDDPSNHEPSGRDTLSANYEQSDGAQPSCSFHHSSSEPAASSRPSRVNRTKPEFQIPELEDIRANDDRPFMRAMRRSAYDECEDRTFRDWLNFPDVQTMLKRECNLDISLCTECDQSRFKKIVHKALEVWLALKDDVLEDAEQELDDQVTNNYERIERILRDYYEEILKRVYDAVTKYIIEAKTNNTEDSDTEQNVKKREHTKDHARVGRWLSQTG